MVPPATATAVWRGIGDSPQKVFRHLGWTPAVDAPILLGEVARIDSREPFLPEIHALGISPATKDVVAPASQPTTWVDRS